jgi:hypothetical protein
LLIWSEAFLHPSQVLWVLGLYTSAATRREEKDLVCKHLLRPMRQRGQHDIKKMSHGFVSERLDAAIFFDNLAIRSHRTHRH